MWNNGRNQKRGNKTMIKINEEIAKLPKDREKIRSAYNMSKETTERLKKFSHDHKIPIQSLVELAIIQGLEKYDKTK